jgi:hypothetical protein
MCGNCIKFNDPENLFEQPDVQFRCISCHLSPQTQKQPFYVSLRFLFLMNTRFYRVRVQPLYRNMQPIKTIFGDILPTSIRANYPRMNTEPIAVIELRLATIDPVGSPYISVKNDLGPFFKDPRSKQKFFASDFLINIDPEDPKALETHQNVLASYVRMLSR